MAYGIQAFNDSGEFTFSSSGYLLTYLGKATFVSTTPAGTSSSDAFNGFSIFTFTYAGPIVVGIGLLGSGTSGSIVDRITNVGSTWTIRVYHSNSTGNSLGFPGQITAADVYVWGLPLSVSGYGLALYDASGNLIGDLLKPMLRFKARVSFTGGSLSQSIPAMTKPAVIGSLLRRTQTRAANTPTAGKFTNRRFDAVWLWDPVGNFLTKNSRMIEYFVDDGGIPANDNIFDTNAIVIEANGLT